MSAAATDAARRCARSARARLAGLYAVTPDGRGHGGARRAWSTPRCAGGAAAIQYRNKTRRRGAAPRAGRRARARCAAARGALFIVNDDADARAPRSAPTACTSARTTAIASRRARVVGPRALDRRVLLRRSRRARAAGGGEGADYVAFGSFFPSPVKPGARARRRRRCCARAAALRRAGRRASAASRRATPRAARRRRRATPSP